MKRNLPIAFPQIPAVPASLLMVKSQSGFGISATVKDLANAPMANTIFKTLCKTLDIKKINLNAISLVFGISQSSVQGGKMSLSVEQEDLAAVISHAIENEKNQDEREELWNICDSYLKYQMLLPQVDFINIDLYSLLELDGNTVRKAFLRKLTYVKPVSTKTSTLYGELDDFVAEQLVQLLSKLPLPDARELLLSMNSKVMYILIDSEISKFVGNNDSDRISIIRCALDYYDIVPIECTLFSWIQEHTHDIFIKIAHDIKNNEYPELHSIFSENVDMRELTMKLYDTKFLHRFKSVRSEFDVEIHEIEDLLDTTDSSDKKNSSNENP